MSNFNFVNKIVTSENNTPNTSKIRPVHEKISSDLYNSFSNLNFSGVYRIGSEVVKNECFIGSAYNITLKVTHHINLLIAGKHYSNALQEWVNKNGIESIDISVLSWTSSKPDVFEAKEQYFINLLKPKFNTVLNRCKIKTSKITVTYPTSYVNRKFKNEFGNDIVSQFINQPKERIKVELEQAVVDNERTKWKPTVLIFDENDELSFVQRGDISNVKNKKTDITIKETIVYRSNIFKTK